MARPRKHQDTGQHDLYRSRLDSVIDMSHPLVKLAQSIGWDFLEERFGEVYADGPGQPPLPTRLMAGLHILKHMRDLSDEGVCEAWLENPYFQYFTGEEFLQHRLPLDRTSMSRWRERMGEDRLKALLQESLHTAHKAKALRTRHLTEVVVDTTVQPKAVAHPTDARLAYTAMIKLGAMARKNGVRLRQSYVRVGKRALIKAGRYAHAKQMKRMRREVRFLRTRLGRVMRDIRRKTEGNVELEELFRDSLLLAERIRTQKKRQDAPKVYSWHTPEVECIGKGKARQPYEFGCKASIATTARPAPGGQFILHAKALHGNPHDARTLGPVLDELEAWTGVKVERAFVDKGYRGHGLKRPVHHSGLKRLPPHLKKLLKRRAAVEPVIGHAKQDCRMGRNYLKGPHGDRANAILAAAGYNFRLLYRWFSILLRLLLAALRPSAAPVAA
jgi:transposase, IS5 family